MLNKLDPGYNWLIIDEFLTHFTLNNNVRWFDFVELKVCPNNDPKQCTILKCKGSIAPATRCEVKLYWNSTTNSIKIALCSKVRKVILFRPWNDWSLLQHFVSSADFCGHGCLCLSISLIKPSTLRPGQYFSLT